MQARIAFKNITPVTRSLFAQRPIILSSSRPISSFNAQKVVDSTLRVFGSPTTTNAFTRQQLAELRAAQQKSLFSKITKRFSSTNGSGAGQGAEQEAQDPLEDERIRKTLGKWLLVCSGLVFGMVVLGGVTRLTESGLSMVEWKPATILPPLTDKEWEEEFEKYKQYPEYKEKNYGMSVHDFKNIFWLEYLHRLLGRGIGIAFAGPLVYYASKGYINKALMKRLLLLFGLGGAQGAVGWYMVSSGLHEETIVTSTPSVSPYRLAAHLLSAFVIYGGLLWTSLDMFKPKSIHAELEKIPNFRGFKSLATLTSSIVAMTVVSGAFVAGLDAGLIYNEWPHMGGPGKFVPSELLEKVPLWKNFFENPATAQFDHRTLAYITFGAVATLFLRGRKLPLPASVRKPVVGMFHMTTLQILLGISTLLMYVPVSLGALHQSGAMVLFSFAIAVLHSMRRPGAIEKALQVAKKLKSGAKI